MSVRIIQGDVRERLKELEADSVHCVVTSPPYWGLRDYGVAGQIGREAAIADYLGTMVGVFSAIRRVLRADGTLWLNLGDSYAGSGRGGNPTEATSTLQGGQKTQRASMVKRTRRADEIGATARQSAVSRSKRPSIRADGSLSYRAGGFRLFVEECKSKDLIGMPWRVAFALQSDGWWLRQDIIWAKPNPMPESVTDRCTKAHEYLFLLAKSPRYYFDATAIAEASVTDDPRRPYGSEGSWEIDGRPADQRRGGTARAPANQRRGDFNGKTNALPGREAFRKFTEVRNRRSVWTVPTAPFEGAHFATFPPALIEPCILAGSPEGGGSARSFSRQRHDGARRRPAQASLHRHRDQSRLRGDGAAAHCGRCAVARQRCC